MGGHPPAVQPYERCGLPGLASSTSRGGNGRGLVRGPSPRFPGWILLPANLRLASGLQDQDPRPFLLGGFFCAVGSVLEERYERLDDGSVPDHARLNELWRDEWGREDGISTILPYEGGIHRIGNPTEQPAVSVHLYGPRLGEIDGRDYDPLRDYACDRPEDR